MAHNEIRTAVVLGGTGWVGRHLCATLAESGTRVVAVARNRTAGLRCDRFAALDLATAPAAATAALLREESAEVVINATDAANATDGWDRTEAELVRANVSLVEQVLTAVRAQPRPVRLVHIGTMHEYSPAAFGTPIGEAMPCAPESAYARTKLAGSQAVLDATRTGAVDAVVLRAVNVCGPHPSPASLPGKLVALLATGTVRLPIADAHRDWLDVRDLARAAVAAARRPGVTGVVNIGSGRAVPMREFVETFVTAAGFPLSVVEDTASEVHSYGGSWLQADIRRAAEVLDWKPRWSLTESLRDMWAAR
ncbi:NAD(P)-dependent oxidoreductase [Nocardia sp. CDC159]|uniref:NAD(P)-dependent oxidoreductase n=1 Tax=Nocardia pulmonis TaxID=2951408 RepID=A0A9X2E2G1_9NOCA|nr:MULTISPECIES: NAD(P)-dependent oxidoreductase [Nocardia]MCM6771873.1 NAD(P)-dependent oxidoreductase [Nocardia pulmonis]MCM6785469.1 NAD(P)-dependent oxidoreductase [Nocardia sp. CDC159]